MTERLEEIMLSGNRFGTNPYSDLAYEQLDSDLKTYKELDDEMKVLYDEMFPFK